MSKIISIKVKPGSKVEPKLEKIDENEYVAFLRARAHDGEANAALIELLSDYFHAPKTSIKVKSGFSSRNKLIELN